MGGPMAPRLGIVDDDLDEERDHKDKKEEMTAQLGPRMVQCPECDFEDKDGGIVGSHIERHRQLGVPVYSLRGKLLSKICPKGCGRFFSRPTDLTTKVGEEERLNEIRELKQHISVCDGLPPLITRKEEEEMAKTKEKRKQKPATPAHRQKVVTRVDPCPLCPGEVFETPSQRGAHFRHRHPDWKSDPRLNPTLDQKENVPDGLPTVDPTNVIKKPVGANEILDGAVEQLEALIESRRDEAVDMDRKADDLEAGAEDIRKEIIALEKKLSNLKKLGE